MRLVGYLKRNILNIICSDTDEYEYYDLEMCWLAHNNIDIVKIGINLSEAKNTAEIVRVEQYVSFHTHLMASEHNFSITTASTAFQVNYFHCVPWIEGGVHILIL